MRLALWGLFAPILLLTGIAQAVPLDTIGTFCGTFPTQCSKGTTSLLAVRGIGTNAYYVMEADPTTGSWNVNVTGGTVTTTFPSAGPTGSAVPAQADYQGLNNGGTLIGAIGDSSGRTIVAGAGTAGTPAGGVLTVQGVTSMTPLLVNGSGSTQPVSGTVTANQGTANATPWTMTGTGAAGTAATGVLTVQGITSMTPLLVNGSGSTQPVSGTVAVSNFPSTVDTNSGAAGASTIRFVTATRSEAVATPLAAQLSNGTTAIAYGTGADSTATLRATLSTRAESVTTPLAAQLSNGSAAIAYGSGATGTTVLRVVNATDSNPGAGRAYADSVRYTYVTAAVGVTNWVQLIASTAALINCIQLFDSSGQTLELGTGAAASETRVLIIPPGGLDGCVPLKIAASTRIAIRALSATTGAIGEIDISGFN